MAHLPRSSPTSGRHTAFWAAKLGLLAASLIAIVSLAVPPLMSLLSAGVPALWAAIRAWLVPPYLFLTVHLIILVIWKLSDRKHHQVHHHHHTHWVLPPAPVEEEPFKPAKDAAPSPPSHLPRMPTPELWDDSSPAPLIPQPETGTGPVDPSPSDESCVTAEADEGSTASARFDMMKRENPPTESIKLGEEEEAKAESGEAEGDPDDSLDATWKAIMKQSPRPPVPAPTPAAAPAQSIDESAAADELNRRFEDFIKKNRDQIRLQTEEWNQSRRLRNLNRALYQFGPPNPTTNHNLL